MSLIGLRGKQIGKGSRDWSSQSPARLRTGKEEGALRSGARQAVTHGAGLARQPKGEGRGDQGAHQACAGPREGEDEGVGRGEETSWAAGQGFGPPPFW